MTPIPPAIVQKLAGLRHLIKIHIEVIMKYKQAHDGDVYMTDLWFDTTMNRSILPIEGFATMTEARNGYCALAMVRLHIDTAARLFAISRVANPDDFVLRVMRGEQINKLTDRDGKRMTDAHLVELLAKDNREWIKRVYDTTSGNVHMSGRHIFMMASPDPDEEDAIPSNIGVVDENWSEASMEEAIECVATIAELILTMALEWCEHKPGLPSRPQTTLPASTPSGDDPQ
jgi:hypothetical protein